MENKPDNAEIKSYIVKESARFATANSYKLDNIYLDQPQKLQVELWFQFPSTVMFVSLCMLMIYSTYDSISLKWIIGIPFLFDLVVGLINWRINIKKVYTIFFLTIGHSIIQWGLTLITIGILINHGHYFYSGIVFAGRIGLLIVISPSLYIYTVLSKKYKMHAKWAYFKRFYRFEFPFEEEIARPA